MNGKQIAVGEIAICRRGEYGRVERVETVRGRKTWFGVKMDGSAWQSVCPRRPAFIPVGLLEKPNEAATE